MKNLTKHYDKFTARERIDLTIAAMARQDKEEFKKLGMTCPKGHYMATDTAYSGFIAHLNRVGISYNCYRYTYLSEISKYRLAMINCKDEFMNYENGIFDAIGKPADDNPIWQNLHKKLDDCLESVNESAQQIKQVQAKLKSIDEALRLFCDEIGIDFNNTHLWFTSGKTEEISADIELDNQLIADIRKDFYEFWNK